MNGIVKYKTGETESAQFEAFALSTDARRYELTADLNWNDTEYIEISLHDFKIQAGDSGYYLLPAGHTELANRDYAIGYYKCREDSITVFENMYMPVFGFKHKEICRTVIVTGMKYDVAEIIEIRGGEYFMRLRFMINGETPYESVSFEIHDLFDEDAGYCDMARIYREYQLSHGFKSIKERVTPALAYAAESPNIRIRMGWKPVPCKILEQTVDNEPLMHVACTFSDVESLMDEYKRLGIEKAEFCLVGWNVSGHDGRWPQALPVEPKLGGEAALKRLISHGKELGYVVSCHTNSTDAYSIADCFNEDDLIIDENENVSVGDERWSGGRTYNVCPKRSYETAESMLSPIAELGFTGTHYIDVITCVIPKKCYNKLHPINKKESAEYFDKLFTCAKELFGAIGSEGAYDYALKCCDTSLYVSFFDYQRRGEGDGRFQKAISDKEIPFWQLVYHGIVLSNPYGRTVNAILSESKDDVLKVIEYGGKPQLYYYAHFVDDGTDWIGRNDFGCHTDGERSFAAAKLKETMDIFGEISYLQYEFMEKHEEISDGVFEVTYSDGSIVTVDYNSKTWSVKKAQ